MTTVVDKAAASEMNLAVLKRMDPEIEQVCSRRLDLRNELSRSINL
jgi:hypothetical protein